MTLRLASDPVVVTIELVDVGTNDLNGSTNVRRPIAGAVFAINVTVDWNARCVARVADITATCWRCVLFDGCMDGVSARRQSYHADESEPCGGSHESERRGT